MITGRAGSAAYQYVGPLGALPRWRTLQWVAGRVFAFDEAEPSRSNARSRRSPPFEIHPSQSVARDALRLSAAVLPPTPTVANGAAMRATGCHGNRSAAQRERHKVSGQWSPPVAISVARSRRRNASVYTTRPSTDRR